MIRLILNDKELSTDLHPGTTLLDFIRYHRNLKGTKIGCREGDCGACTVLVGEIIAGQLRYRSATSCLMPLGNADGRHIVTVEGVNMEQLNPIQQALCEENGTQCGFCTPGFVMSLAGLCLSDKPITATSAIAAVDGNICRCTGYKSIERAATRVATIFRERNGEEPWKFAAERKILPGYFSNIEQKILGLQSRSNGQPGDTDISRLLAGGTDLYVQQHDGMTSMALDLLSNKTALKGITEKNGRCYIGAAATVSDLLEADFLHHHFPSLKEYLKLVSSTPIRNMATVAGNFVNASPIGDLTIFFLALDARLVLCKDDQRRTIALKDFYKGYKQLDKAEGEIVEQVWFELPMKSCRFNFEKVSKRTHLDIASVNSAIWLETDGEQIISARLSAGGVAPVPKYLSKASAFLSGKPVDHETVLELCNLANAEISPISDARGTAEYKRLLLQQLIKAHFIRLFPGIQVGKLLNPSASAT